MDFPGLWAAEWKQTQLRKERRSHRILRLWVSPANRKRRRGSRRSRIPPRRAHDTLQPQDESIIVGYYTFAKVSLRTATPYNTNKNTGGKCLWQDAMVSIVQVQETQN